MSAELLTGAVELSRIRAQSGHQRLHELAHVLAHSTGAALNQVVERTLSHITPVHDDHVHVHGVQVSCAKLFVVNLFKKKSVM